MQGNPNAKPSTSLMLPHISSKKIRNVYARQLVQTCCTFLQLFSFGIFYTLLHYFNSQNLHFVISVIPPQYLRIVFMCLCMLFSSSVVDKTHLPCAYLPSLMSTSFHPACFICICLVSLPDSVSCQCFLMSLLSHILPKSYPVLHSSLFHISIFHIAYIIIWYVRIREGWSSWYIMAAVTDPALI